MYLLNLTASWDLCSWRSWKGGGRWRSGGGCWTCSATQGSRGSGRRADSGSQGTLTSPHEGFPRILQAPRGPGTGTHTWCTCFLSWCGAAEEQEELWCQLRLEGTGWRGWRPWCRLSTPRMLRPAPPPTHTHHLPHPSETHAPKHTSHTHTLSHMCVCTCKKRSEYFGTFPATAAAVLAVGPKNGPKVRWWRIGQKFCRSKLFTCSLILEGEGTSIYCNANCKPGPRTTNQTFVKTNHAH